MEDTIVSFEVAKLLKEKGYTDIVGIIKGKHYYNYKGEVDGDQLDFIKASLRKENLTLVENYPAQTLSLAQKWLREVHNIHIVITLEFSESLKELWYYGLLSIKGNEINELGDEGYTTYELALEAALQEALKLI